MVGATGLEEIGVQAALPRGGGKLAVWPWLQGMVGLGLKGGQCRGYWWCIVAGAGGAGRAGGAGGSQAEKDSLGCVLILTPFCQVPVDFGGHCLHQSRVHTNLGTKFGSLGKTHFFILIFFWEFKSPQHVCVLQKYILFGDVSDMPWGRLEIGLCPVSEKTRHKNHIML